MKKLQRFSKLFLTVRNRQFEVTIANFFMHEGFDKKFELF